MGFWAWGGLFFTEPVTPLGLGSTQGGTKPEPETPKQEELPMTTTKTTMIALCVAAFGTTSLHAEDSLFEVSAFIVGIEGEGFAGDEVTEQGDTWAFHAGGSQYFYSVDDLPQEHEQTIVGPLGGFSAGVTTCEATLTDTSVQIYGVAAGFTGITEGGDPSAYAQSYAQVHGEFHLSVPEGATMDFELKALTEGQSSNAQLFIRKLVNGNFQTVYENVLPSNAGLVVVDGTFEAEAGYYQLYFSGYGYLDNDALFGQPGSLQAASAFLATIDFSPLPNIADITGDGIVDGADLARVLGAWGTSASGGDLNGDGIVDGADLALILANWT